VITLQETSNMVPIKIVSRTWTRGCPITTYRWCKITWGQKQILDFNRKLLV